jgi:hypothetical protein
MAFSDRDSNPLDVVFRNLGALLPVLLLFLGWVAATWKRIAKQNASPRAPARAADDEAERTRKVQEEVRRKIAERRGERAPPAPPAAPAERPLASPWVAPRPVAQRGLGRAPETFAPPRGEAQAPAPDYSAEQERQVRLAREIAAMDSGLPPPIATHQAYAPPSAAPAPATGWLADALRDPANARRAMVLREVLGPPGGLAARKF